MSEDPLRDEGARIEHLLGEIEGMAGPQTWPLVEELMRRVVGLYAAGLERVLDCTREHGALDEPLWERLLGDEVVASLLLLHGLHPRNAHERIEAELARVKPWLDRHGVVATLDSVRDDEAHIELEIVDPERAAGIARVAIAVERAVHDGAPELARVVIDGVGLLDFHTVHEADAPYDEHAGDGSGTGSGTGTGTAAGAHAGGSLVQIERRAR